MSIVRLTSHSATEPHWVEKLCLSRYHPETVQYGDRRSGQVVLSPSQIARFTGLQISNHNGLLQVCPVTLRALLDGEWARGLTADESFDASAAKV